MTDMTEYPILDKIKTAIDLKTLDVKEYDALCSDIRRFLVEHISKTGGHLASNLGIVELTVAIQLTFDTSVDRVIFDVGHQCYVHKLLTGRRDGFDNLRNFGGMSGFPKPEESIHDAFVAGHASTSVSVACGMARSRTLIGAPYHVCAVIGDGALTGGIAYEALNDVGRSRDPLVVILNDNEMSISKNVGAMSAYLSKIRLKPGYAKLKTVLRRFNSRLFRTEKVNDFFHKSKDRLKKFILPVSIFENMGFQYVGPLDGHNIESLCEMLRYAKQLSRPVLIHVKTVKGKGYKFSEERPEKFHGMKKFDVNSGTALGSSRMDFSTVFGTTMCRLARENPKICAITAAMRDGTGLSEFASLYPKRFFDVGIAEEHAITMASAMAKQGTIPVFAVYSTFLQRGYDQLIHDASISNVHAIFAIDRAGITGEDGETHQGVFDIGMLQTIPNVTVLCPASFDELSHALRQAVYDLDGVVAIRYPKGSEGAYSETQCDMPTTAIKSSDDSKITLVTYGTMINEVLEADKLFENNGISVDIVKIYQVQPLDIEPIIASVRKTGRLLVAEECIASGSIGQTVLVKLMQAGLCPRTALVNIGDRFLPNGSVSDLKKSVGLDAESLYLKGMALLKDQGVNA